MNQKKDLPGLVIFAILTLVTTFSWVGFEIYRALTVQPKPDVPPQILQELSPTLDQQTLESLVNKVYLDDETIGDTVLSGTSEQTVSQSIEEVITEPAPEEEIATTSGET